jgi:hypothetical protein
MRMNSSARARTIMRIQKERNPVARSDLLTILGIITGLIGLILLLFPVWGHLTFIYDDRLRLVRDNIEPTDLTSMFILICLAANLFGLIFAGLTKMLLKSSKMFGAIFIILGLLNACCFLWDMVYLIEIFNVQASQFLPALLSYGIHFMLFPFFTIALGASLRNII